MVVTTKGEVRPLYPRGVTACPPEKLEAKLANTSRNAFVNSYTGTGPHISFNTFNNPRHAVIPALLNAFIKVIDHATTKFQAKIKEVLHIS